MDFSEGEICSWKVPSSPCSPIINCVFPCVPWVVSGSLCHLELVSPCCGQILLIECQCSTTRSKEVAGDSGTRASHRSQAYFVYIWFNQVVAFWPLSKLTSGWPPPCPLPAARPPGSSPLNLQTNMGHIGWSNQLQTQLWKCQDVLFFVNFRSILSSVICISGPPVFFFFPSNYSCVFYCLVKLLNFVLVLLQTPLKATWGSFTWGSLKDPGFYTEHVKKGSETLLGGTAVILHETVSSPYFQGNKSKGVSQGLWKHIAWIPTPKGFIFSKAYMVVRFLARKYAIW